MAAKYNPESDLLFLPLGGSGEIGMNLNLYACSGKWIAVDMGMTFAGDYYPGVDLILPDPGFIEERQADLLAIVLTHGHEDHIGALPYLWESLQVPIYATPFTMELVRGKLAEAGLLETAELHEIPMGGNFTLGDFDITYVPLAHSIAEGNALLIKTPHGRIFHTGDWKLDDGPLIGQPTTAQQLSAIGDVGILALIGDSTNAFSLNTAGSESDVAQKLIDVVGEQSGRVVVTTFASNVARLQSIARAAQANGRKLGILGRSMHRIIAAAKATGYLTDFPDIIDEEDFDSIPREQLLVMTTGCQGEARAALTRLSEGGFRNLKLAAGDTVIFSSKMIPGNEISIGRVLNRLVEAGVHVITEKDADVHVSGHPGRPDLEAMYGWIRPQIAIPVHGEVRHMQAHAELATRAGVGRVIRPLNGTVIRLAPGKAKIVDEAPTGRLLVDGRLVIEAESETMAERRRIMHNGHMAIMLVLDEDGAALCEPAIVAQGIPGWEDEGVLCDRVLDITESVLETLAPGDLRENDIVEEQVRRNVRRMLSNELGKRTVVVIRVLRPD